MNSNDGKPKANGFSDNGDDGMYEFLNNYYKEFNPVG